MTKYTINPLYEGGDSPADMSNGQINHFAQDVCRVKSKSCSKWALKSIKNRRHFLAQHICILRQFRLQAPRMIANKIDALTDAYFELDGFEN